MPKQKFPELTRAEENYLNVISSLIERLGASPSLREIAREYGGCGSAGNGAVFCKKLAEKGYITYENKTYRGIKLTGKCEIGEFIKVDTALAAKIGLNEAIAYQGAKSRISMPDSEVFSFDDSGLIWMPRKISEWQSHDFPFWSEETISRLFSSLEKLGLIAIGKFNSHPCDKTNWYAVNHEAEARIREPRSHETIMQQG